MRHATHPVLLFLLAVSLALLGGCIAPAPAGTVPPDDGAAPAATPPAASSPIEVRFYAVETAISGTEQDLAAIFEGEAPRVHAMPSEETAPILFYDSGRQNYIPANVNADAAVRLGGDECQVVLIDGIEEGKAICPVLCQGLDCPPPTPTPVPQTTPPFGPFRVGDPAEEVAPPN